MTAHSAQPIIRGGVLAALAACTMGTLGGCITSPGRSQYTALTSHRVEPGPAANDELAVAFGLDEYQTGSDSLASAESERER